MAKVVVACDHRGVELRDKIASWLKEGGHDVIDMGPSTSESVDYPGYAFSVGERVVGSGGEEVGILICGWGNGMAIAANKVKGGRAALCHTEAQARYARWHNDANVLVISAEATGWGMVKEIVRAFLEEGFEGGRHARRLKAITD